MSPSSSDDFAALVAAEASARQAKEDGLAQQEQRRLREYAQVKAEITRAGSSLVKALRTRGVQSTIKVIRAETETARRLFKNERFTVHRPLFEGWMFEEKTSCDSSGYYSLYGVEGFVLAMDGGVLHFRAHGSRTPFTSPITIPIEALDEVGTYQREAIMAGLAKLAVDCGIHPDELRS